MLIAVIFSGKKVVQGKLNFQKETMEERRKKLEKEDLVDKIKSIAEKERHKDTLKKQAESEKLKQKEEKLKVD